MTDPIVPDPAPQTPPPAAPAYSAAPATPGAGAKKGLSLTSFILGIAAIVLFWTSWFAVIVGIVGLVLGLIGRSREPGAPRWMWLLGIIFSIVGIVIGVILIIVSAVILASYGNLLQKYSN